MRRVIDDTGGLFTAMALLAGVEHAKRRKPVEATPEEIARLSAAMEEWNRVRERQNEELRKSQQSSKNAQATRTFLDTHKKPRRKKR